MKNTAEQNLETLPALGELLVQFEYRARPVSVNASINGYAAAWMREHPYGRRSRCSKVEHERKAKNIAGVAVYSILRDWIKGQITAIETHEFYEFTHQ